MLFLIAPVLYVVYMLSPYLKNKCQPLPPMLQVVCLFHEYFLSGSCHTCNPISQFLGLLVLLGFYAEVFIYTVTPTGASASFSGFQLWSLSHFELAFVQGQRCGAHFILLQMAINLHQNHSLKRLDLLLLLLWVFFFAFFKCMFLMLFSIFTCLQLYGFISGFCSM